MIRMTDWKLREGKIPVIRRESRGWMSQKIVTIHVTISRFSCEPNHLCQVLTSVDYQAYSRQVPGCCWLTACSLLLVLNIVPDNMGPWISGSCVSSCFPFHIFPAPLLAVNARYQALFWLLHSVTHLDVHLQITWLSSNRIHDFHVHHGFTAGFSPYRLGCNNPVPALAREDQQHIEQLLLRKKSETRDVGHE